MVGYFSHCYLLCFSAIVHETQLETIRNTMNYSLKQSAEATGKSKPTVLRALQSGRLSGKKDDNGEWQIDPAELHRVFPPVQNTDTRNDTKSSNEIGALQRELEILRDERRRDHELIEDLRHDREDLRKDRDHWRQQATALLTDQREKVVEEKPANGFRVRLAQWIAGNK